MTMNLLQGRLADIYYCFSIEVVRFDLPAYIQLIFLQIGWVYVHCSPPSIELSSPVGVALTRPTDWSGDFFGGKEDCARGWQSNSVRLSSWPCAWLHWTSDISALFLIIGRTSSFVKKSFIDVFVMGYRGLLSCIEKRLPNQAFATWNRRTVVTVFGAVHDYRLAGVVYPHAGTHLSGSRLWGDFRASGMAGGLYRGQALFTATETAPLIPSSWLQPL